MPKAKRGAALFDLLSEDETQGAEPLKVPGWWTSGSQPPKMRAAVPSTQVEMPVPAQDPEMPGHVTGEGGRFIQLDGDRIRLSFTSITAAVAVFVTLIALLGVFEWGRWNGERTGFQRGHAVGRASYAAGALDEIEAARMQPPATHVVRSLLKQPDTPAQAAGESVVDLDTIGSAEHRWIRDYTYIVAQEFSAGAEDDARRAQVFLARQGVATEVVRYASGAMQLITTEGFDRGDATQRQMADKWLAKVHAVGAEYFETGGRYKLEGYFKTLRNDTW